MKPRDIDTINGEIDEADQQLKTWRDKRAALMRELGHAKSPFGIGDIIEDRRKRRMKVARFDSVYGDCELYGPRIKTNGAEGCEFRIHLKYDEPVLIEKAKEQA